MGTHAPSHYQGRKIGLNSKHKGSGFRKQKEPEGTSANPHSNSIAARIHRGDKKLLKQLGMTKDEANQKLRRANAESRIDSHAMERWYRTSVQYKRIGGEWDD